MSSHGGDRALASSLERMLISLRILTLVTSSDPNYVPKAPPPDTITLGGRASTHEFYRDTKIQSRRRINLTSKNPMPLSLLRERGGNLLLAKPRLGPLLHPDGLII